MPALLMCENYSIISYPLISFFKVADKETCKTKIAGVKGWTLTIEQHTLAVVRDDDMILAGPINAVEEAIKMKGTAPKASSPVTDIDQDSVFNLLIDGSPLIGKDLAKSVTDDREMMAFIAKPFFSVRATLDNRGLLWSQTRPAHIEDLMAYFSTMPSIALPFDFPVKL